MPIRLDIDENAPAIKGILFDKDGTLLNFVALWGKWCELVMEHVGAELRRKLPSRLPAAGLPALLGVICDAEGKVVDYREEGLLSTGTNEKIREAITCFAVSAGMEAAEAAAIVSESIRLANLGIERLRPVQARTFLPQFLELCRDSGLRLAVVTADETEDALKHLEWMGLTHYFDCVIGNDKVPNGKPHPDMVLMACEKLGLAPSEIAVIGDTESDMRMGRSAGAAMTIAIMPEGKISGGDRGTGSPYGSADVLINSYEQLLHTLTIEIEEIAK